MEELLVNQRKRMQFLCLSNMYSIYIQLLLSKPDSVCIVLNLKYILKLVLLLSYHPRPYINFLYLFSNCFPCVQFYSILIKPSLRAVAMSCFSCLLSSTLVTLKCMINKLLLDECYFVTLYSSSLF